MELERREFLLGAGVFLGGLTSGIKIPKKCGEKKLESRVAVVGGGMSGVCAAIACARMGIETVLIQDRSVLGGNSSSEVRLHILGADWGGNHPFLRETGVLEELRLENQARNPNRCPSIWDLILYEKTEFQNNLKLFLDTALFDLKCEGRKIKEIICFSSRREEILRINADYFIDATGNGTLAYLAGANYMWGRESKKEFGESLALDVADKKTMGSTILFQARDMGRPVPFKPPFWARKFPSDKDLPFRNHSHIQFGFWWIEWGGELNIIKDDQKIRKELLACALGVWDHIKNHGNHGAENYALEWIGFLPARRESRRIKGLYILREQDLKQGRIFDDAVAYGGWPLDDHPPKGIHSKKPPFRSITLKKPYTIPLRSIISKDVDNLILAGRAISVTHVAFSSTRVMGTCSVVGEAGGTLAALALKSGKSIKAFNKNDIKMLQLILMRNGCFIPGFKRDDPDDLAMGAKISASSYEKGFPPQAVADGYSRKVGKDWHMWKSKPFSEDPKPWIDIEIEKEMPLTEIRITFDSDLSKAMTLTHNDYFNKRVIHGIPKTLVSDFEISILMNGSLKTVYKEKGNYMRNKIIKFKGIKTKRIRIRINKTWGESRARIVEVAWYA